MNKRHLFIGLMLVVVAVAVLAVACGGSSAPASTTTSVTYPVGSSSGEIKVGHIYDATGAEAVVGGLFKQAIEYVFHNQTVGGRSVKLYEADSKSTTEGAVEAARELVEQDHVDVLLGPTQTGQKAAVATYAAEKNIPVVLYNVTPPGDMTSNPWVLGCGGLNTQYGNVIADYMYKDLGYRSMSTLGPDDSSGHEFFDPVTNYFAALGGTVVQQQWAPGQTADWSPYLTNVQKADVLCAWVGGSGIPLLTAYYDTGTYKKIPIVGAFHGGFFDPWIPRNMFKAGSVAAAKALIGDMTVSAWNPDSTSPENTAYVAGFNKFGAWQAQDGGPASAVEAGQMVLKGLESVASNLSGPSLRDAILKVDMVGPMGRIFFAPGDNIATLPFYIIKIALQTDSEHPGLQGDFYEWHLVKTYDAVPPAGLTATKK